MATDMPPVEVHALPPDASFDGGDLDCGNGLLLLIRQHLDPLPRGGLLEFRSTDSSVEADFPAWCRMTGNELVSWTRHGRQRSFLVCKGPLAGRAVAPAPVGPPLDEVASAGSAASAPDAGPGLDAPPDGRSAATRRHGVLPGPRIEVVPVVIPTELPPPGPAPAIAPLSVMGIGSWPRPRWMRAAIHEHLEGRLGEDEFQATADDAVRLAVSAQLQAGVDVVTDGEQRRDNYASFVGARLDNCQLIPLTDLLPLVDHPEEFAAQMRSLDVPAAEVRHPALFGPLGRSRPLAAHELAFVRTLTDRPVKVALPGPYLLTRTMWMECISDRAYRSREHLAGDVVRVLREEVHALLAEGAALVQLDEPVLSEVVMTGATTRRTFMCGALSEKGDPGVELAFARELLGQVVAGLPPERLALHVCRGNWTPDEGAALTGDYRPLLGLLGEVAVGTLFLELATPRAGELEVLRDLPPHLRLGVGVVNQKRQPVEDGALVLGRARRAVETFGADRVLLTPDCGFATFADNPVASAQAAETMLRHLVAAARTLRGAPAAV